MTNLYELTDKLKNHHISSLDRAAYSHLSLVSSRHESRSNPVPPVLVGLHVRRADFERALRKVGRTMLTWNYYARAIVEMKRLVDVRTEADPRAKVGYE